VVFLLIITANAKKTPKEKSHNVDKVQNVQLLILSITQTIIQNSLWKIIMKNVIGNVECTPMIVLATLQIAPDK